MSASGRVSERVASSASRSLIWWLSSMMIPTVARVVAPNAAATAAGAVSCSVRSAAWICWARVSRLRWRPADLSADWIFDRLRRAASAGVGAR